MSQSFPTATRHSLSYYESVLLVLIEGIKRGWRQSTITDQLNAAGIPTGTGAEYTAEAIKHALKRLRAKTGPHYQAALELCFEGRLTPSQCKPLLQRM